MKLFPTFISVLATLLSPLAAEEIRLWSASAPGSEDKTSPEVVQTSESGERKITNVHIPSITPFLPVAEKATGAAVIVAPGGGHRMLCMSHEGDFVAQWLADHGIAAFVLKYRLASEPDSTYTVDGHAVADMHRAIRMVRSRSAEWKVRPNAIGVMGFSAGGEVCFMASQLATPAVAGSKDPLDAVSSRPDFQALIYPGRSSRIAPSPENPPTFLAASANDREDISEGLASVYLLYKKAKVPVELHLYASGAHGFGVRVRKSAPVDAWTQRFEEWLTDRGLNTSAK